MVQIFEGKGSTPFAAMRDTLDQIAKWNGGH
jgi:hypothetical protein